MAKSTKKSNLGNFRQALTLSEKTMIAGKNAEQNEQVIKQVGKNELVLHTKLPGSPFVNIKENKEKVDKNDIRDAALFCAVYSQAWKKTKKKKDVEVHVFIGADIYKEKGMPLGTFGVKKFKKITVKKAELEKYGGRK
jgi:predicted ribosome quality control (RQC) complex YloA/Tae2 family protein